MICIKDHELDRLCIINKQIEQQQLIVYKPIQTASTVWAVKITKI